MFAMLRNLLNSACVGHRSTPANGSSMTKLFQFGLILTTVISPGLATGAPRRFLPPAPAMTGKSVFFASPDACAASGNFSERDCVAAFDRVAAVIRARAPKFAEKYECVLQFKLCESDADGFLPAAMGVEMVRSREGLVALPVLAVETPADMLRDPEPPAPGRDLGAEASPRPERSRTSSPYGVLALEATNLAAVTPPSLQSYRRYIAEAQLRQAGSQQETGPDPNWRARR